MTNLEYRHRKPELNEAGFTLLEIIAVLVILSILAVVAVPRYFDLQTQARDRAVASGMSEAMARVNGHFATRILSGDTPGQILYADTTLGTSMGDFAIDNVVATGTNITIHVSGRANTAVAGASSTVSMRRPGTP